MKTLILSNYLQAEYLSGIVCSQWGVQHPSLADFQSVVLDMKLDTNVTTDTPKVNYSGYSFYRLYDDIIRLLQAGGVVICLNYYTFVNEASLLYGTPVLDAIRKQKLNNYNYEYKWQGGEETSYDWLDMGFLLSTRLDRLNIRAGAQIKVVSSVKAVKDYFVYVSEYHKVIEGIVRERNAKSGKIRSIYREKPDYSQAAYTDDEVEVFAVAEVTDEPIAAAIKYRGFTGMLVFLPTYKLPDESNSGREEAIRMVSARLRNMGEYYYEENRRELGVKLESPPWLLDYRVKPAEESDKNLEKLEKEKTELIAERDKYDRMLTLINGYGTPLEETVGELFGKEWFGFEVEETEKGHPIDLFIKNTKTGQTLAVQVTGVSGNFTQKDKHFGALMGYLPEHEEKNTDNINERIVIVINTYREFPLVDRTDPNDISTHVEKLAKKNGICIIRTCELFQLWSSFVENPGEFNKDGVFSRLFECEGVFN
jgi:hypothetical protein